ncbi:glutathione S-transferase family protein [Tepidamorphus sp. 3E244]|uniref:glutathione S-transferase family protein n=1 Tax=Tepidamorphus sp. 3E244 TaxID=3385498 RepID=UPI0038FC1EEF
MGMLVDGEWQTGEVAPTNDDGAFERDESVFRNWVTKDGEAGPDGVGGFKAEDGRYHLYVAWACPWAHRALIFRKLKGLEDMIPVSVVHWYMGDDGWTFKEAPGVVPDTVNGADYLREVYQTAKSDYTGKVTVPVLWDKQRDTIVSNESADIIRMFNSAFDEIGAKPGDYVPDDKRDEIDAINERVYDTLNNGVYKAGFAKSQDAYEKAVKPLFETMDWLDEKLGKSRYLTGDETTEADWRLFPTLFRFDAVYNCHFKCHLRRLTDYPNLWPYARDLYQQPGIAETTNLEHAKLHYYRSHESVNPSGIVPIGPDMDWDAPHGRG